MNGGPAIISNDELLTYPSSINLVSVTKLPLFNENGEIIGTFGLARDITSVNAQNKNFKPLMNRRWKVGRLH
jgi:hypothetical protein